ncbi:MAG: FMN-binding glutamate synthase family protein [Deltaproteobacteria bacterium]|nr:FMN-binding glutamate synthase family protein [Deltaproteobacteria bacterium]
MAQPVATSQPQDVRHLETRLSVNLDRVGKIANAGIVLALVGSVLLGHFVSFYFHFLTVFLILLNLLNFYWRHVQKAHTLLSNFGFTAQLRYLIESVGPEFRQYLYSSDNEERPFSRNERTEVYRKAKGIDSSAAFGTQLDLESGNHILLRHSFFPTTTDKLEPFRVTFGEEREIATAYAISHPVMISGMSFGALGSHAVRALARGAKKAGIPMNTGEGGYPKYHLMEGADLIFQIGTAKFGVRHEDGRLHEGKLAELAAKEQIAMVEIKFSQGAKPGKGGLLPKEKLSQEIAELRGVPMGQDVVSPPRPLECVDEASTVAFIRRVQEVAGLPVGIKFCLGRSVELRRLVLEMKRQGVFPDFMTVDGAEGGTGAAPRSFMDGLGLPLLEGLARVQSVLEEEGVRDRLKLIASGKLIDARRQLIAMSLGADACYTARGFMLALGCIQALQCNQNTCPVGITTHNPRLERGLDIEAKSTRVANYVAGLCHNYVEMLAATGKTAASELGRDDLFLPGTHQGGAS